MKIGKLIQMMILLVLLTSCFEDEVTIETEKNSSTPEDSQALNPDDPNFFESDAGFPLEQSEELVELDYLRRSECVGNIDCSMSDLDRLADDFSFRSGKLILRGNLVQLNQQANQWFIADNLEVLSFALRSEELITQQESDFHQFTPELRPYYQLVNGLNVNLDQPIRPVVVTQGKLGLREHSYRDPGLCDVFAAENFEKQSQPPWPKYDYSQDSATSNYTWPQGTGIFNENNDLFAAETLIVCGEINILNRTLKLEAKNIIFYNSHIKVMSDRDLPTGFRVTAENIGYFGANLIESNIINRVSGQKNSSAPTIDLGASGVFVQVPSTAPANNRYNAHYMKIFMAEHE